MALFAQPALAAVLIWDGDTATSGLQDGGGTWNATDSNRWYNGSSSAYQAWSNSNPDSAVFGVGSGTAGTVTLASPLTASGLTFNAAGSGNYLLNGGTLTLSGASTITTNASATIDSVLNGTAGLTVTGPGTLTLGGANVYSGTTAVNAGSLLLDFTQTGAPAANIVNSTANYSDLALGGGTLALQGQAGATNSQWFNSLTVNFGSSAIVLSAASSNALSLACGSISRSAGGTLDFTLPSGTQSAGNGVTTTSSANNGILGGYATVGGADWATVGSGGLILAYTGYTTLSGSSPTIADGPATNVRIDSGSTGNISLSTTTSNTATINTLLVNDTVARTIDVGAGNTLRLGAIGGILLPAGAGGLTIGLTVSAGTLTAGGADNAVGEIVLINNSANPITINSAIADNGIGAVSLTKAGSGTLLLNGNISLGGTATISSGLLGQSGGNSAVFGAVCVDRGTYSLSGTGQLGASSEYVGYSGSGTFSQSDGTNSVGYAGLYLGYNAGGSGTYNLSGSGRLSAPYEWAGFSGTGIFTQTGGANAIANALYLGNDMTGGSGTYNLSGSGQLSAPYEDVGSSGTGTFTQSGGTNTVTYELLLGARGTYNLTGGALLVPRIQGAGTFNLGGGTLVTTASFSTGQAMTLTGSGGSGSINTGVYPVTLSGVLSGAGGLNLLGAGTLTLTASDNYSGGTTISGGTLQVGNGGSGASIGDTSGVLDNGLLAFNNSDVMTLSSSIGGGGSLLKTGAGTLILSGSNDYNGRTTVNAGTLCLTDADALPSGGNLTVAAGATFVFDPSLAGGSVSVSQTYADSSGAAVAAVPEPGSLALLAAALGCAAWTACLHGRRRSPRPKADAV